MREWAISQAEKVLIISGLLCIPQGCYISVIFCIHPFDAMRHLFDVMRFQ